MISLIFKFGLIVIIFVAQKACDDQTKSKSALNSDVKSGIVKSEKNSETKSETKMENVETKNLPKLESSFSLNDKTLTVEYKVKNTTDKAIYLYNVLWSMGGDGKAFPAEESVYVYLLNDKTLFVAKHIPKLPRIKSVELREIPYVTKVEAGKEFGEKIDLLVPVEEFNPYFPKMENSKTELENSENVVFSIQFIRDIDGLETKETAIDNALSVWHRDLFGNVETLQTKSKAISVQVNKRTDEFERF